MPVESLRLLYPWPKEKPDVPPNDMGWVNDPRTMYRFCGNDVRVVLELGTWMGASARFWADNCPNATVICVDTWRGGPEQLSNPDWAKHIPLLFDTFIVTCWEYQERMIPLRHSTAGGMSIVCAHGIEPDLVYVDASHLADDVCRDVITAGDLFPKARIFGDDWTHPTGQVPLGVRRAMASRPRWNVQVHSRKIWELVRA